MDYAMSANGLTIHSRADWPCANCRPDQSSDTSGHCLCLECARGLLCTTQAGEQSTRELLDDITDALVLLDCRRAVAGIYAN